jgi:hypothetical protein
MYPHPTVRYPLLTIRYPFFTTRYLFLAIRYLFFTIRYLLLTIRYPPRTQQKSLFDRRYEKIRYDFFRNGNPLTNNKVSVIAQPTSTIYSGLKRLLTQGFLLKNDTYEMDDPFFAQWIVNRRNNV